MRQARERPAFAFEAQLALARRDMSSAHDLESDPPLDRFELLGKEHRAHAAFAQKADDAVRTDGGEAPRRRQGAPFTPAVDDGGEVLRRHWVYARVALVGGHVRGAARYYSAPVARGVPGRA
jgi:hypothetical protein